MFKEPFSLKSISAKKCFCDEVTSLDLELHSFKAYDKCFVTCMLEQQRDDPASLEFLRMLLEQRCLLAECRFLVECHQAVEKGFFLQRALQNSLKRTLREAPFISYANLESTWRATDSTVPPGSDTLSLNLGPRPLCWCLTGWINRVLFFFFSLSSLLSSVGCIKTWLWLWVTML